MSHIATFRKNQYALAGESSDSDEDAHPNGGGGLQFDQEEDTPPKDEEGGISNATHVNNTTDAPADNKAGVQQDDGEDDDLLLCVGTTAGQQVGDPTSHTTRMESTSVFNTIGSSYVAPPRQVPHWISSANRRPSDEAHDDDGEEEEEEIFVSKLVHLKPSDIKSGELSVKEALCVNVNNRSAGGEGGGDNDVDEEELLLDDDDDEDSGDDEMARMRLADELQATSAGMTQAEILELLEEFTVQKKRERAVKRALKAKLQEQKHFREKLRAKNSERDLRLLTPTPTVESQSVSNDPRHSEYLNPDLAVFLAEINQGIQPPSTNQSTALPPPPATASNSSNSTKPADPSTGTSTVGGVKKEGILTSKYTREEEKQPAPLGNSFYDHDVAESRMQNQLSDLLSEFASNQNSAPKAAPRRSSSTTSTTAPLVGNDFLRERRNSRLVKEASTGAMAGVIQKGSSGTFGQGDVAVVTTATVSPLKKPPPSTSLVQQHFSVPRVAPVHKSKDAEMVPASPFRDHESYIEVEMRHTDGGDGSVLPITDPRALGGHHGGDPPPPRSSGSSVASGAPSRSNSTISGSRRVGGVGSRVSSSVASERKASVASAMASSLPLSQQVQMKLENEQRTKEKQQLKLESDRERRLLKKRNSERDQCGLPPIGVTTHHQHQQHQPLYNNNSSMQQQQYQSGGGGGVLSLVPRGGGGGEDTMTVSAVPYHLRQAPTPPTTPPPPQQDIRRVSAVPPPPRAGSSNHHHPPKSNSKRNTSSTSSSTTVGGFTFVKR